MIAVIPAPEPKDFDTKVRQPGNKARKDGRMPDVWTKSLGDLKTAYGGICAYSAFKVPGVVGGKSVEHFVPKSKRPDLAYEWSNYRFVCATMNGRKSNHEDVLDPFKVKDGWFQIEFGFFQVKPAAGLPTRLAKEVDATIKRLKLNEDEECRLMREEYAVNWRRGCISFDFLKEYCPFVAKELIRQGHVDSAGKPLKFF